MSQHVRSTSADDTLSIHTLEASSLDHSSTPQRARGERRGSGATGGNAWAEEMSPAQTEEWNSIFARSSRASEAGSSSASASDDGTVPRLRQTRSTSHIFSRSNPRHHSSQPSFSFADGPLYESNYDGEDGDDEGEYENAFYSTPASSLASPRGSLADTPQGVDARVAASAPASNEGSHSDDDVPQVTPPQKNPFWVERVEIAPQPLRGSISYTDFATQTRNAVHRDRRTTPSVGPSSPPPPHAQRGDHRRTPSLPPASTSSHRHPRPQSTDSTLRGPSSSNFSPSSSHTSTNLSDDREEELPTYARSPVYSTRTSSSLSPPPPIISPPPPYVRFFGPEDILDGPSTPLDFPPMSPEVELLEQEAERQSEYRFPSPVTAFPSAVASPSPSTSTNSSSQNAFDTWTAGLWTRRLPAKHPSAHQQPRAQASTPALRTATSSSASAVRSPPAQSLYRAFEDVENTELHDEGVRRVAAKVVLVATLARTRAPEDDVVERAARAEARPWQPASVRRAATMVDLRSSPQLSSSAASYSRLPPSSYPIRPLSPNTRGIRPSSPCPLPWGQSSSRPAARGSLSSVPMPSRPTLPPLPALRAYHSEPISRGVGGGRM